MISGSFAVRILFCGVDVFSFELCVFDKVCCISLQRCAAAGVQNPVTGCSSPLHCGGNFLLFLWNILKTYSVCFGSHRCDFNLRISKSCSSHLLRGGLVIRHSHALTSSLLLCGFRGCESEWTCLCLLNETIIWGG